MFQGFSGATVDFMWGIRFNNEKGWFEAHKEEYLTTFQRPMKALADEVYVAFTDRHPDLGLIRKVTRIYRDARRLHGRGPYKDHLWLSLTRPHEEGCAEPVFWFELGPEGYSYGMGYYAAKPATMARFRARLDRDPKPFEKLARTLERQDVFTLEHACYKKPKGDLGKLLSPWYNSKNLSLICQRPHDERLFSPDLVQILAEGYDFLAPYYAYFLSLEGDPDPRA